MSKKLCVYATLLSKGAADLIVAGLIAKGYGIEPAWAGNTNGDSMTIIAKDNMCVILGLTSSVKDDFEMTSFVNDVLRILTDKQLKYYSAVFIDMLKGTTEVCLGNMRLPAPQQKPAKVIPFPKPKTQEVKDDGIIDDDKVPPPN